MYELQKIKTQLSKKIIIARKKIKNRKKNLIGKKYLIGKKCLNCEKVRIVDIFCKSDFSHNSKIFLAIMIFFLKCFISCNSDSFMQFFSRISDFLTIMILAIASFYFFVFSRNCFNFSQFKFFTHILDFSTRYEFCLTIASFYYNSDVFSIHFFSCNSDFFSLFIIFSHIDSFYFSQFFFFFCYEVLLSKEKVVINLFFFFF